MNPRNELPTAARPASETEPNKTEQCIKYPATVRTHDHGATQRELAGIWGLSLKESLFPSSRHINAELPLSGRIRFVATDLPRLARP